MGLVKTGEELKRFHDAKLVRKGGGLQRRADDVFQSRGVFAGVVAADNGGAAVGIAQGFQDFDSAGLAGAVRAEQAEDFAFADTEVYATARLRNPARKGRYGEPSQRVYEVGFVGAVAFGVGERGNSHGDEWAVWVSPR